MQKNAKRRRWRLTNQRLPPCSNPLKKALNSKKTPSALSLDEPGWRVPEEAQANTRMEWQKYGNGRGFPYQPAILEQSEKNIEPRNFRMIFDLMEKLSKAKLEIFWLPCNFSYNECWHTFVIRFVESWHKERYINCILEYCANTFKGAVEELLVVADYNAVATYVNCHILISILRAYTGESKYSWSEARPRATYYNVGWRNIQNWGF